MQTDNRNPKAQPGSLHPACSACGVPFVEHDGLIRTRAKLQQLRAALVDAIAYVEALAGRDNSCDPTPDEELAEWKAMLADTDAVIQRVKTELPNDKLRDGAPKTPRLLDSDERKETK